MIRRAEMYKQVRLDGHRQHLVLVRKVISSQDKQDRASLWPRGESSKSAEPEPLGFRGESAILFYVGAGPQNWASAAGRETAFALPGLMLQVALNPLCDMAGYALVPLQQRSREPEVVWKTKQSSQRRRPQ